MVKRFEIYWVNLDPTIGSEIQKTRPALIISPDEMNKYLNTVIVAPLTSTLRDFPSRIDLKVDNKKGQVALDQLRAIDKSRLSKFLSTTKPDVSDKIINCLQEMFAK